MQIDSVDTNAGVAICAAPSRIDLADRLVHRRYCGARSRSRPSHRRPKSPRPAPCRPSVIVFSDCPIADKHDNRRQNRQRNRRRHDQRAPPRSQEQQNHQRRQPRRDRPLLQHAFHRRSHEHRLIEQQFHLQFRRQLRLNSPATPRDSADHARGSTLLRLSRIVISTARRPSRRTMFVCTMKPIAHACHVLHIHRHAVDRLDRHVVERADQVGAAIQPHVIFGCRRFSPCPPAQSGFGCRWPSARRSATGRGRKALRIEIDHHLRPLPAPRLRHARALHRARAAESRSSTRNRKFAARSACRC